MPKREIDSKQRAQRTFEATFQSLIRWKESEIKRSIIWAWRKRWPLVLVAIGAVAIPGVPLLWQLPAQRIAVQYPNILDLDRAKLVEESRRNLISGIGTIATIAGAVVLVANLMDSKARLAHDTARSAREFEIAESRLLAERFSKAIELLGKEDNESVQLGGIYSLEQIAKDSTEYYWAVLEVLTAFIRKLSPLEGGVGYQHHPEISFLAQTALTVVCRQKKDVSDDKDIIILGAINLTLAQFSQVNVKGNLAFGLFCNSNLWRATFDGLDLSHANFMGAYLYATDLKNTNLSGANFQLANLSHADLTGSILYKANFDGAVLYGTTLKDVKEYSSANWEGVKRFDEAIGMPKDLMERLCLESDIPVEEFMAHSRNKLMDYKFDVLLMKYFWAQIRE